MSAKIAPFTRLAPGWYEAYALTNGGIRVWREGEGPDKGKWFFSLSGHGFSDTSEPYLYMQDAMTFGLKAFIRDNS